MKLSFVISAAALYSMASAVTHYHTQYHYVTVDAQGNYVGGDKAPASSAVPEVKVVQDNAAGGSSAAAPASTQAAATTQSVAAAAPAAASSSSAAPAAQSSSSASGSGDGDISSSGADADFAKSILDAHNAKRALHSAGALSWDTDAYKYAQAYADKYVCGAGLVHSGGKYGENLAEGFNSGTAALDAWYDESKDYDYKSYAYNHFTQVVWKGTTKVGCAYKKCDQGMYVICSYDPAGNVIGQFPENVFPN